MNNQESTIKEGKLNVLLTGSSGFIGSHLLNELVTLGYYVIACVRQPTVSFSTHVKYEVLDFSQATDINSWLPLLNDVDIVINAVGIISETENQAFDALHTHAPSALFSAAEIVGVKRIIQISALGADEQATSQYHLSKLAADTMLQSLSLSWFILRPSLVYGEAAKSMGLFRALAALPIIPLIGDGHQQLQPVHINDLVATVIHCLGNDLDIDEQLNEQLDDQANKTKEAQKIIDVVGPDVITLKELLLKQRYWLGLNNTKTISIPFGWLIKLMPLTVWLKEPALTTESLEMLQRGNTSESSWFKKDLKIQAKSMDTVLSLNQPSPADHWYARLYFMRPLLQVGLAFVWFWTALVSAFLYPQEDSYLLLERLGIGGVFLPITLYGAALMDFILGVAMFLYQPLQRILLIQIALIAVYTLLISFYLPEYWLHPFGEITKNIPMLLAILVLYAMTEEKESKRRAKNAFSHT